MAENTARGVLRITDADKAAIASPDAAVDIEYLKQFDSFLEFFRPDIAGQKDSQTGSTAAIANSASLSPQEQIDAAVASLNSALADDPIMKRD